MSMPSIRASGQRWATISAMTPVPVPISRQRNCPHPASGTPTSLSQKDLANAALPLEFSRTARSLPWIFGTARSLPWIFGTAGSSLGIFGTAGSSPGKGFAARQCHRSTEQDGISADLQCRPFVENAELFESEYTHNACIINRLASSNAVRVSDGQAEGGAVIHRCWSPCNIPCSAVRLHNRLTCSTYLSDSWTVQAF